MSGKSKPAEIVRVDLSGKRSQSTIVLQNSNPNILEVIENATHVVTYNFEGGKWEKGSCEGACFLTKNCMPPYNTVMILNKVGIENFSMDIDDIQNMKLQAPYVMIKYTSSAGAGAAKIVGLWFHDEREQHTFYAAMDACKNNQSKAQLSEQTTTLQQAARGTAETNMKTSALKGLLCGTGSSAVACAVQGGASESKTKEKTKKAAPSSSSSGSGIGYASDAMEDYFGTASHAAPSVHHTGQAGPNKSKGKSNALKSILQVPEVQYEWVGDRLLPVAAPAAAPARKVLEPTPTPTPVSATAANAASIRVPTPSDFTAKAATSESPSAATSVSKTDRLLESLSETKTKCGSSSEDMFTDRGISSVQSRAAFEVPEGIDGKVAATANDSYLQATKASAKKEASIPAHHLQAGGVGSSFFFADSPGAVTPASTPPLDAASSSNMPAEKAGAAVSKTSLLRSVLSFGSLNSSSSAESASASPSLAHASSTGSLSSTTAAAADVRVSEGAAKVSPPPPQPRKSISTFLSPSDLMKMTRKLSAKK